MLGCSSQTDTYLAVYFLGLSLLWIPNFVSTAEQVLTCMNVPLLIMTTDSLLSKQVIVLLANNPYRGLSSIPISVLGLIIQHLVAIVIIMLKYDKIQSALLIEGDEVKLGEYGDFVNNTSGLDISIAVGLVLFMDVAFCRMIFKWCMNRPNFFEKFNDRCLEYTAAKLGYEEHQEWRKGRQLAAHSAERDETTQRKTGNRLHYGRSIICDQSE